MCIGFPMRVVRSQGLSALCDSVQGPETVSLALTGPVPDGGHVLVHLGSAIRVLDAEEARLIGDALAAVDAAQRGDAFEHLIGDLIDREPELPPHLRPQKNGETKDEHRLDRSVADADGRNDPGC